MSTGLRDALADAGFPPCPGAGPAGQHASADPGRPARVAVRPIGSPEWRNALLHRDWLRAGAPGGSSPSAATVRAVPGYPERGRELGRLVGMASADAVTGPDIGNALRR